MHENNLFSFAFSQPEADFSGLKAHESMRILILGDFSGRGASENPGRKAIGSRPILQVDIDNFDTVMARLNPNLRFEDGEVVAFETLEDFHPDSLFRKMAFFRELAKIRAQLNDVSTFPKAADALRALTPVELNSAPAARGTSLPEDDRSTFERLLGGEAVQSDSRAQQPVQSAMAAYVAQVVAPHIVPDAPLHQDIYLKALDAAVSAKMRELIHQPDFQALEAIWRALWLLVSNLETDENLSLHVLDVSQEELFGDLSNPGETLSDSGLYRLLVEQNTAGVGGKPWSLVVGHYAFGNGPKDVALLAACGFVAARAGGPFLSAADSRLFGCRSVDETPDPRDWEAVDPDAAKRWQLFRQSPLAPWIGLAWPRILLRLPYGEETDPVESFGFEETASAFEHEALLWGNPALFCALLLGRSYLENGESMLPGDHLQIDELPAYIPKRQGEARLMPCAEAYLTDRAMETILGLGIMPFLSHRNANQARLARFQSIADPGAELRGFWDRGQ